jgi:glutamyl-tRNA reductase
VIVVGLSHRSAPIEVRERLAVGPDQLASTLARFSAIDSVAEAVLLSTCNRVEVYAATTGDEDACAAAIARMLGDIGGREVVPHLTSRSGAEALHHLFRVAASLDSLVVGEPQILGQLKEAIRCAIEARTIGAELHVAMKSALSVAKRARSETAIGEGQVSVPSVAVDLARRIFEDLRGQTALLVGAGEMAESAAQLLARAGAKLLVVNRSSERAARLAETVAGTPMPWSELERSLIAADIVIASTASQQYVVTKSLLKGIRRQRRGRSLFLIDIAVPRDVDPRVNDLENVYLYDIDDLSKVVAQSLDGRRTEAERAEALVRRETEVFAERRSQLAMKPIIVALRERARYALSAELDRSYKGRLKHLTDDDKHALQVMIDAAVNKLMHAPTKQLKQLAATARSQEVAELMCQLFELDGAVAAAQDPEVTSKELPLSEVDRAEVDRDIEDATDDDAREGDESPNPHRIAAS